VWTGSNWLRIWTSGGSCEHGDEPWGSLKLLGIISVRTTHYLSTLGVIVNEIDSDEKGCSETFGWNETFHRAKMSELE
jgi:hypothetical protein